MKHFFSTIFLYFLFINLIFSQNIEGTWHGIGDFEGNVARIDLKIEKQKTGYTTLFDFPDNNYKDIPADTTIVNHGSIEIKFGQENFIGFIPKEGRFQYSWFLEIFRKRRAD